MRDISFFNEILPLLGRANSLTLVHHYCGLV
jgi:hypothetical protein